MGLWPIFCFQIWRNFLSPSFPRKRESILVSLVPTKAKWIPACAGTRSRRGCHSISVSHGGPILRNEELTNLVSPAIADMGLECLGVEYSPSHGNSLVRVYIDAADHAVTVDDCELVSRQVSALFDVNDPIVGRYTLEVSSPGLDRPLYTPEQFARFIGQEAKIELNLPLNGRRRFQGPILAVEGETITVEQDGAAVQLTHANVHKAKLVPQFDEPKKPGKSGKAEKGK